MEVSTLIDHLAEQGPLLAHAARRAGADAPVPRTRWTVRELVTHVGGVHRWAADIVATRGQSFDTAAGAAVGTGPDDDLLDWFLEGHAELVATLRAAPADLDCAAFLPAATPLTFWARRQAHETAVHRADAEAAAGSGPVGFAADLAQDGIAELVQGFATRRSNRIERQATIALHASDGPDWLIVLGGERIVAEPAAGRAGDAAISGTSSELYLWLWNRDSGASVGGDPAVAALWRGVRVRWS